MIDLNEDNRVTRDDFVDFMDREICAARLHIQSFNDLISHLKNPRSAVMVVDRGVVSPQIDLSRENDAKNKIRFQKRR